MFWVVLCKIGTVLFSCAMLMPFVGLVAFFFGAGAVTIISAAVVLLAFIVSAFFEDTISLLMVPVGLIVGGIGAILAWVFGWNILACAAFAICLVSVGVLVLLFLMVAKFRAR